MKEKLWEGLLMCFLSCLGLPIGIIIFKSGFENDLDFIGSIGLTIILIPIIPIVKIICSLRRVNRAKEKLAAHKEKVKQIEAKYETMEGQTEQHEDGVIDQN